MFFDLSGYVEKCVCLKIDAQVFKRVIPVPGKSIGRMATSAFYKGFFEAVEIGGVRVVEAWVESTTDESEKAARYERRILVCVCFGLSGPEPERPDVLSRTLHVSASSCAPLFVELIRQARRLNAVAVWCEL